MFVQVLARIAVPVLICAVSAQQACADVYAWVDASGALVYSDVAPPPGVRLLHTVPEPVSRAAPGAAPRAAPRASSSADARQQADMQRLSDRVLQLEQEVDSASRRSSPVEEPDTTVAMPARSTRCDGTWADCWFSQNPAIYPVNPGFYAPGVVVLPSGHFGGFHSFHRHRFNAPRRAQFSSGFRRR